MVKENIGTFRSVNVLINVSQIKNTIHKQKHVKQKRFKNLYVTLSSQYGILRLILVKYVQEELQFGTKLHKLAKNVLMIILFSITQV